MLYDRLTLGHNLLRGSAGGGSTRQPIGSALDLLWSGSPDCTTP